MDVWTKHNFANPGSLSIQSDDRQEKYAGLSHYAGSCKLNV